MQYAEQRFDQIEQYLRGRLSAEAAAALEAEMSADPELASLVQQHRLERQGLEVLVERDLLTKMQAWDREIVLQQPADAPSPRGTVRPMIWVMRAAAVLAIAVFGWWLLRDTPTAAPDTPAPIAYKKTAPRSTAPNSRKPGATKPSTAPSNTPQAEKPETGIAQHETPSAPQSAPKPPVKDELPEPPATDYAALADEYYHERDFIPPQGSKSGSGSASYDRALDNYRDGRYSDAVSKLLPGMNGAPDALLQKELLAHSLYKSQQFNAAIPYFQELIATHKKPYAERAEWAMALTLLHQMPAKKPLLDRVLAGILANPQHPFYSQARALQVRL